MQLKMSLNRSADCRSVEEGVCGSLEVFPPSIGAEERQLSGEEGDLGEIRCAAETQPRHGATAAECRVVVPAVWSGFFSASKPGLRSRVDGECDGRIGVRCFERYSR